MAEWQWKRWTAVERIAAGELTMGDAARALEVSGRQLRRVVRAIKAEGQAALQHGNRGHAPVNKLAAPTVARIVTLRQTIYRDFNDAHFTEKLRGETPPIVVSVATVRRILRGAQIPARWQRRPRQHRRRRERRAQAGQLLLWDGSRHDWLEGRGPWLCLVGAIDDATGDLLPGAHFVAQECAAAYLHVLAAIVAVHGVPWSIYMDQHGALKRNDAHWTVAEELRGRQDPTQVGAALEAFGIAPIYALSPQAKGRVERLWGTLQDRLVSELRLAQACTMDDANLVLMRHGPEHNARFAVPAREPQLAWRTVPAGVDIARVCSFRYAATVLKDNTVRLGGTIVLDIPPGPRGRSYADRRVEVRQLLDGAWRVYLGDQLLATAPATPHGELRALRRRKRGRGAAPPPAAPPEWTMVAPPG